MTVIAIEYDSLKASIENYYNKEKPEVVITEEHFDPGITVIFIDGVPSIVHNDRTDEAGTFVDFEFETIKGLNKDDYYVTTFLDDDAMICPLPLEFEPAMWIIEFNSPFLHIWTFNPNNAADVGCGYDGGCDAHTFPFMECLECSIQWGHWHPTGSLHGVRYYSNSVALFGLYYDDSDTYEEEDR